MLNICVPKDINKIKMQINALKWQLERDIREEDKLIHLQAINALEKRLSTLGIPN